MEFYFSASSTYKDGFRLRINGSVYALVDECGDQLFFFFLIIPNYIMGEILFSSKDGDGVQPFVARIDTPLTRRACTMLLLFIELDSLESNNY